MVVHISINTLLNLQFQGNTEYFCISERLSASKKITLSYSIQKQLKEDKLRGSLVSLNKT
jgi:hypothetical protein